MLYFFTVLLAHFPIQVVNVKSGKSLAEQLITENTTYVIRSECDLHGERVYVPYNSTLLFKRKGKVVNGKLVGNESKLKGDGRGFVGVVFEGAWDVPMIPDSMFDRSVLSDNQVFENIMNLLSESTMNEVVLSDPEYIVCVEESNGYALRLKSLTTLRNQTTIRLQSNSRTRYDIILVSKANGVAIEGGVIVGDVKNHQFVEEGSSEWGHGININSSSNVTIKDVRVEKCIGDGIAITGGREDKLGEFKYASKNIRIENVVMDSNRRQGMSIIHAQDVIVNQSVFCNTGVISATPPTAGIDIEPNSNARYKQGVRDIVIMNSETYGTKGAGIKIQGHAVEDGICAVSRVFIVNCEVDGNIDVAADGAVVRNCRMKSSVIRGTKDMIKKVEFDNCSWENGNGVLVYYSSFKNAAGEREGGVVDTLIIRDGKILVSQNLSDEFYKGAVSFHGGVGGVNHLICEHTEINLPNTVGPRYNLTKANNIPDLQFVNCTINMPGRVLYTRGAWFNNCTIKCKEIDIKENDPKYGKHFNACTIIK